MTALDAHQQEQWLDCWRCQFLASIDRADVGSSPHIAHKPAPWAFSGSAEGRFGIFANPVLAVEEDEIVRPLSGYTGSVLLVDDPAVLPETFDENDSYPSASRRNRPPVLGPGRFDR